LQGIFDGSYRSSERIKYNGQTRLNVVLKDDTQTINEVVVQGKRIERNDLGISAREQSSATQKVSMEDLVAVAPVTSIEDALQGQLGGVDIVLGGGDPGALQHFDRLNILRRDIQQGTQIVIIDGREISIIIN